MTSGKVARYDVGGHIIDGIPEAVTRTDDEQQRRFDAAVNERAAVLAMASRVLPAGFKSDLLTVRQIREAALKAAGCTQDFAGKSDDTVHGAFDHYMKPSSSESSPRRDSSNTNRTWTEAQARYDSLPKPVPAWQQPLSMSRADGKTSDRTPEWQKPLSAGRDESGETHGTGYVLPKD